MSDQREQGSREIADKEVREVIGLRRGRFALVARLAWLLVAAAVVAGGLYWLFADTAPPVRYVTQPVTRGDLTVVVTATGSVEPVNTVDVSSELSGTVRTVNVDYNSEVEAGQVLAELDTDKLEAQVLNSQAKLSAARARVEEAAATIAEKRSDLDRKRVLVERKVASVQDLDIARAAYDRAVAAHQSALAEVEVAEAELTINRTNLAKARIRAPITGVVLVRNVDPGQTVATSLQTPVLFSIAEDLTKMELQVDVDEADVGKVAVGQEASFTVDAYPERTFPATIRDVRYASEVVQGVVTYKALLDVDNSDLLLRPGMTATADIVVKQVSDAILVPNAALRFSPPTATGEKDERSWLRRILPARPSFRAPSPADRRGGERTVWVLEDATPAPRRVTIGATDGRRTEIAAGDLAAGETIIVESVAADM